MSISHKKYCCTVLQILLPAFIFFEKVFEIELICLNKLHLKLNDLIIQTEKKS
jgi:hypothetical protein